MADDSTKLTHSDTIDNVFTQSLGAPTETSSTSLDACVDSPSSNDFHVNMTMKEESASLETAASETTAPLLKPRHRRQLELPRRVRDEAYATIRSNGTLLTYEQKLETYIRTCAHHGATVQDAAKFYSTFPSNFGRARLSLTDKGRIVPVDKVRSEYDLPNTLYVHIDFYNEDDDETPESA